jgi:hypothetical protein
LFSSVENVTQLASEQNDAELGCDFMVTFRARNKEKRIVCRVDSTEAAHAWVNALNAQRSVEIDPSQIKAAKKALLAFYVENDPDLKFTDTQLDALIKGYTGSLASLDRLDKKLEKKYGSGPGLCAAVILDGTEHRGIPGAGTNLSHGLPLCDASCFCVFC